MNKHLIFTLFLLLSSISWGQRSVTEYQIIESSNHSRLLQYVSQYDEKDRLIEKIYSNDFENLNRFSAKYNWIYENENLVTYSYSTWSDSEEWNIFFIIQFTYDNLGRLIEQDYDHRENDAFDIKTTFINNFPNDKLWPISLNTFNHFQEEEIESVTRSIAGEIYIEDFHGGNQDSWVTRESIFNTQEKLISQTLFYNSVEYGKLKTIEYNDLGYFKKIEDKIKYSFQDPWKMDSKKIFEYTFENELLIQQKTIHYFYHNDGPSLFSESLRANKYYCNGFLKESHSTSDYNGSISKTASSFEYSEVIDCPLKETMIDALGTNSLNIYPNPSSSQVTIESDLLNESGVLLNIYSLSGQLLRRQAAPSGYPSIRLDLRDFNWQRVYVMLQKGELREGAILSID